MDLENSSSNKIDTLVDLVEKLLEKLSAVDCQLKEKYDIVTVNELEAKVSVTKKIVKHLEEGTCRRAFSVVMKKLECFIRVLLRKLPGELNVTMR